MTKLGPMGKVRFCFRRAQHKELLMKLILWSHLAVYLEKLLNSAFSHRRVNYSNFIY